MEHIIEAATIDDRDAIVELLPRLADFKIPRNRAPKDLWAGDAKMVHQWAEGERTNLDVWLVRSSETLQSTDAKAAVAESAESNAEAHSVVSESVDNTLGKSDDKKLVASSVSVTPENTERGESTSLNAAHGRLKGVCIVSYKPELLSEKPSAHLEVLVLEKTCEGQGVAAALIKHAQTMAAAKGAESMSLHVFANNERAREFYDRHGFEGELLRYSKPLQVKKIRNFFGKHIATSGVARSIKKLLRTD